MRGEVAGMLSDDRQKTLVAMAENILDRVSQEYPNDSTLHQMAEAALRVAKPEESRPRIDVNELEHPRFRGY